jgi:hypothetical protein
MMGESRSIPDASEVLGPIALRQLADGNVRLKMVARSERRSVGSTLAVSFHASILFGLLNVAALVVAGRAFADQVPISRPDAADTTGSGSSEAVGPDRSNHPVTDFADAEKRSADAKGASYPGDPESRLHIPARLGDREAPRDTSATFGESAISSVIDGSLLVIKTASRLAGAIGSLTWRGKEFVNSWDHGRELQSASFFDSLGECFNPTEAGAAADGTGPTSTSILRSLDASGSRLTTETQMAFWLRPGEAGECPSEAAVHTAALSNHILRKTVEIGFQGMPHVIEHRVSFKVPQNHRSVTFEALTGYMPAEFSRFWTYDPATKRLAGLSDGPGEQPLPVIIATPDSDYAMGVYSPALPQAQWPSKGYGRWRFDTLTPRDNATVKWNCVFRRGYTPAGRYEYRCYSIVGSLQNVTDSMDQLHAYFQNAPVECPPGCGPRSRRVADDQPAP